MFAEDALFRGTGFTDPDSLSLADIMKQNEQGWKKFDFKLVKDVIMLPGVNVESKKADGSVRYYGDWEVMLPATDSTEAKSGIIKGYESFDFNEEGKIVYSQFYGDTSGLFWYLTKASEEEEKEASDEM